MNVTIGVKPGETLTSPAEPGIPALCHVFDENEINAVYAALAAERPLLIRGEPGIGKSQLARAAAVALKRAYVQFVVDARTESSDLLWHFDAVARLAKAQILGALCAGDSLKALEEGLAEANFLHPRPLWWAFNWTGAEAQAKRVNVQPPRQAEVCNSANGCVVLIDEIDKAETDVPNGLLEALGVGSFVPHGHQDPVTITGPHPLVIITTNEERTLPDAFLRRCLVLHKALPHTDEALRNHLIDRAKAHFNKRTDVTIAPTVFAEAADMLIEDRRIAKEQHWLPLPGQAEYLDLVRAVINRAPTDPTAQTDALKWVRSFVLRKNPGAAA